MKVLTRGSIMLAVGALVFGVTGAGSQVTTGPLYGIDSAGDLYDIDAATGVATWIGPGAEAELAGLEYDPSTSVLYAGECTDGVEDEANLWSVDPESGVATVVGPTGIDPAGGDPPCITGLAMDGSGTLYGVYRNGVPVVAGSMLVTFSKATGDATDIAQVIVGGPQGITIGGLAFHPTTGVLYVLRSNGNLYSIDTTTAAATLIGATNIGSGTGLAFGSDGTLYASNSANLFTLDPATGASTLVGPHFADAGDVEGLAYNLGGVTPPPPPDVVVTQPTFTG